MPAPPESVVAGAAAAVPVHAGHLYAGPGVPLGPKVIESCSLRARGMPNKGKKKASSDSSGEVSLHRGGDADAFDVNFTAGLRFAV